jgi:hypothetical protein
VISEYKMPFDPPSGRHAESEPEIVLLIDFDLIGGHYRSFALTGCSEYEARKWSRAQRWLPYHPNDNRKVISNESCEIGWTILLGLTFDLDGNPTEQKHPHVIAHNKPLGSVSHDTERFAYGRTTHVTGKLPTSNAARAGLGLGTVAA